MSEYLSELFGLKDKLVVVTGATGQLGQVICHAFKQAGSRVVGVDLKIGDNVVDQVEYFSLDITKKSKVERTFKKIFKNQGKIDILINNAGVSTFKPFEIRSEKDLDWVMGVNLKGTFFCIQSYISGFDKSRMKQGSIVNIGSVFGAISPDYRNYTDCDRKNSEIYGATKAGIIQMTRYFAVHLAERNIRVNAVSPGGIYNPKNPQGPDFLKNYAFRVPLKRMAQEKEIPGAILYLASDAASYTTGQNIVVDGGLSCW